MYDSPYAEASVAAVQINDRAVSLISPTASAVYANLIEGRVDYQVVRRFVDAQLAASSALPIDLPVSLGDLETWSREHIAKVGEQYKQYLASRKAGEPRRNFSTRSHALYFIKNVAPTKLVDGAWLYGLLQHADDPRCHGLVRTYLEELGDGVSAQNHVVLYQKLLAANACDSVEALDEPYYVQGAIQLALAYGAADYLPEIIGYNLGYEQLPLHLLICAYELNELGIDPYYFTLHTTIDNAHNGHAHKAIAAISNLKPHMDSDEEFMRRVRAGYRLNELGANTMSIIEGYDVESELINILRAKSAFGKNMHSDYCRVAGRSVNSWLENADDVPDFLAALTKAGWFKRGEPAEQSRFWHLVQGPRAEMFGVFNSYELQVLRDWITDGPAGIDDERVMSYRSQQRQMGQLAHDSGTTAATPRGFIRRHNIGAEPTGEQHLRDLEATVAAAPNRLDAMRELAPWMAPHLHSTPVGLMATRMFVQLMSV